jgi:hypothetical protein
MFLVGSVLSQFNSPGNFVVLKPKWFLVGGSVVLQYCYWGRCRHRDVFVMCYLHLYGLGPVASESGKHK